MSRVHTFGQNGETIFLEAESFVDRAGWVVDQQSLYVMCSAYLLAHGLGKVNDISYFYFKGHVNVSWIDH
ncbi:MAG: hypothetical protein HKN87_16145 [Saprospiraceae bacterium]|nr:hypothetical protein [Saprospiraceae bacterium]